jgi:type I restriction enzyme S subunit
MRDGWKKVAISEVCIMIKRGQAPSYTENKSVTVLNQKCIRDGRLNFEFSRQTDANLKPVNEWAYLNATDTLVNSTGVGTLGRVAFVRNLPEPTTVDSHVTIVRPDNKKVEPSFLGLSLNFREADIEGLAAGSSGQTELSREALGNLIITLPTLPEQKRIVDLISSVDSYIEALQQQLESAKTSRNAVLHKLLNAGGDDWTEYKLASVTDLITDGSHFSPPTTGSGIPYVTVRDIKDGQLDLDNSARISKKSFDELEKSGCRPLVNDILFSKDGTVGKVAIVSTKEKFVVLSSLAIIRANTKLLLPKFLAITLSAPDFQSAAIGSKTGLAIKRIVLKHLKELSIKIPPLLEQSRIIELIDVLDEVVKKAERAVLNSKRLRFGLLSELINGEHEIPPNYDKVMGAA